VRTQIAGNDEIDLLSVEELGVDASHIRGVSLVMVIHELNPATNEATAAIDLLRSDGNETNAVCSQRTVSLSPIRIFRGSSAVSTRDSARRARMPVVSVTQAGSSP